MVQPKLNLNPPYNCPICYKHKTIRIDKNRRYELAKEDSKQLNLVKIFHVYCTRGCFDHILESRAISTESVDAFNFMVDYTNNPQQTLEKTDFITVVQ